MFFSNFIKFIITLKQQQQPHKQAYIHQILLTRYSIFLNASFVSEFNLYLSANKEIE